MMIHELKTWPVPFRSVVNGRKTFEVREADRPYAEGDVLLLREWTPPKEAGAEGAYSGDLGAFHVPYLMGDGAWGIPSNLVILALRPIPFFAIDPASELGMRIIELNAGHKCENCAGDEAPVVSLADENPMPHLDLPPKRFRFN